MPKKMKERIQPHNRDLCQNTNSVLLYNKSDSGDNKNIINNNVKEKYENNIASLKIVTPLNAHTQCTNDLNKTISSKETSNNETQRAEEIDETMVCGLGIFRPSWLQPYATAKVYLFFYSIIGILHGSYYSCLIGTLSTLEKRFAFKSKISGVVLLMDEIIPVFLGTIIGYYATKAHRPRMVALGMIFSAVCSFVASLPYFIYGPAENMLFNDIKHDVGPEHCDLNIKREACNQDRPQNLLAVICLMFGTFLKGFGSMAYYAIGLAYLDDNSDKQSTPLYLAVIIAFRYVGILFGYLMSSGFLKYYENPLYKPDFGPGDPRWIGAWWMGFVLQGVLLVIFTIPVALFPRRLPSFKEIEKVDIDASKTA